VLVGAQEISADDAPFLLGEEDLVPRTHQ
jgi:hypothetical protein